MAGFGVSADPFSFTDTEVEVQGRNVNPEGAEAQCEDANGDVEESTVYGEFSPVEMSYKVCRGGSFDSTVKLGAVKGDYVITSIAVTRNNRDALAVVVTGIPKAIFGDTATIPNYTPDWPTGYLTGGLGAVAAGVGATAGNVISSTLTFAVQNTMVADSVGDPKCVGIFGGRMDGSTELQSCDTLTAASADTDWALAPGSGQITEVNTDYQTGTFLAFQNITQDT